jgi:hypothetical protein
MRITVDPCVRSTLHSASYDVVCCTYFSNMPRAAGLLDLLDYELCGAISRVRVADFFTARDGETALLPFRLGVRQKWLLVLGLGSAAEWKTSGATGALNALYRSAEALHAREILLEIPGRPELLEAEAAIDVVVESAANASAMRVQIVDAQHVVHRQRARLAERARVFADADHDA